MTTLYNKLHARVENYNRLVNSRARKLCAEAGLDPTLLGIHPNNAMADLHYGRPWPGVDYKKVRETLYLINVKQWQASNILRAYCDRKLRELGPEEYHNFMYREK